MRCLKCLQYASPYNYLQKPVFINHLSVRLWLLPQSAAFSGGAGVGGGSRERAVANLHTALLSPWV